MLEPVIIRLDTADRAVSPVIGVVLMVGITVIMGAVVGTTVLGVSDQLDSTAPQVQLSVTDVHASHTDNDSRANVATIVIRHAGGEDFKLEKTDIIVETDRETTRFNEPDSDGRAVIRTASSFRIRVDEDPDDTLPNGKQEAVTAGGNRVWNSTQDEAITDLTSSTEGDRAGSRLTITIVDTESGEIIFDRTITI